MASASDEIALSQIANALRFAELALPASPEEARSWAAQIDAQNVPGLLEEVRATAQGASAQIRNAAALAEAGDPNAANARTALDILATRIQARSAQADVTSPAQLTGEAASEVAAGEGTFAAGIADASARAATAELREKALALLLDNPVAQWFAQQSQAIKLAAGAAALLALVLAWRAIK